MNEIKVLPQETIDLISAGEVVVRPAAALKELIENSIDANSKNISVECKDGGLKLMRITDDGIGIEKNSLKTAFLPHATSKIIDIKDLDSLHSFGFRGEALSSIGAVCKCEVITKRNEDLTGSRYLYEGSKEISLMEVGAPNGTTFIARDIFYNTPARLKFLKSASTESSYIAEIVENAALSNPSVSFSLVMNNRNTLKTSGNGDLKECIYRVYGKDAYEAMLPIDASVDGLILSGFYAKPDYFKANRKSEKIFVNKRPINSKLISKAIEDAYDPYLMNHQFPMVVLFIDIDPSLVDVNVHPSKSEVRFNDEKAVYSAIYNEFKNLLSQREMIVDVTKHSFNTYEESLIKSVENEAPTKADVKEAVELKPDIISISKNETDTATEAEAIKAPKEEKFAQAFEHNRLVAQNNEFLKLHPVLNDTKQLDLFEEKLLSKDIRDEYHIIGQVFDTYWLVQYEDTMLLIDQHAAHEKVLFEKFMKQYTDNSIASQLLTPSIILTLSASEEAVLLENIEKMTEMGFDIEHYGGRDYRISSVPEILKSLTAEALFKEILSDLADGTLKTVSASVYDRIATMACKAAVKGNMRLSDIEARALIYDLLELDNPYHCPHGRPTIIKMTKEELEKKFKRIV